MKKLTKIGIASSAGLLLACSLAVPAQAIGVNNNCGIVTCSVYFSRDLTKRMVTPSGVVAVVAGVLAPGPAKAVAVAAGIVSVKSSEAAGKNQCLRVRYTRPLPPQPSAVVGLYSDNSKYCHNS